MIELRWLDRITGMDLSSPDLPPIYERVLQYREWPAGLHPGGNTEPQWLDVPITQELARDEKRVRVFFGDHEMKPGETIKVTKRARQESNPHGAE